MVSIKPGLVFWWVLGTRGQVGCASQGEVVWFASMHFAWDYNCASGGSFDVHVMQTFVIQTCNDELNDVVR